MWLNRAKTIFFYLNYKTSRCALFVVCSLTSKNYSSNYIHCRMSTVMVKMPLLIFYYRSTVHICLINNENICIFTYSSSKKVLVWQLVNGACIQLDHIPSNPSTQEYCVKKVLNTPSKIWWCTDLLVGY